MPILLDTMFNKACIRNVTIFMICIRNVRCTNRVVYETSGSDSDSKPDHRAYSAYRQATYLIDTQPSRKLVPLPMDPVLSWG